MNSHSNTPFDLVFTPLVYPPFIKYSPDAVVEPGTSDLITTENNNIITAEDTDKLITES